jgi:hypothetical protein
MRAGRGGGRSADEHVGVAGVSTGYSNSYKHVHVHRVRVGCRRGLRVCTPAWLVILLYSVTAYCLTRSPLAAEMAKLNVHTALLFPSQAADEWPLWSADSQYLAANIEGKWLKLDMRTVHLKEAKWHEQRIAVIDQPTFTDVESAQVVEWQKGAREQDSVVSKSGIRVELPQRELSRSLVLSKGKVRKTLWRTALENCGALSLSPDGRYVAFLCEMNGVFVTDIDAAFSSK